MLKLQKERHLVWMEYLLTVKKKYNIILGNRIRILVNTNCNMELGEMPKQSCCRIDLAVCKARSQPLGELGKVQYSV